MILNEKLEDMIKTCGYPIELISYKAIQKIISNLIIISDWLCGTLKWAPQAVYACSLLFCGHVNFLSSKIWTPVIYETKWFEIGKLRDGINQCYSLGMK